jgi:proline dehydrogenase
MEKALFGFAKQWIAGDTLDDALRSARQTYKKKMNVIINKLGEYNTSKKIIAETVNEYQTILLSLKKSKIEGGISVKPTQVGLLVSKKECIKSFSAIIKTATLSNSFVWIDMESSDHTDEILEVYHKLFSSYERLGLALQANLKRTKNDLVDLLERGAKIRLVKGAYRESAKISYKSKDQVDEESAQRICVVVPRSVHVPAASVWFSHWRRYCAVEVGASLALVLSICMRAISFSPFFTLVMAVEVAALWDWV